MARLDAEREQAAQESRAANERGGEDKRALFAERLRRLREGGQ